MKKTNKTIFLILILALIAMSGVYASLFGDLGKLASELKESLSEVADSTVEKLETVKSEFDLLFEEVDILDDFGDPTGEFYVKAKTDFEGTYKNSSGVSNGNLKWNIKAQDGKKVIFIIKEKGLPLNISTAYYTNEEYTVKVKDNESGETTSYTGIIAKGDEGQYNCIMVTGLSSYIYSGAKCKIVISNDRGTYNLGDFDSEEIESLLYDTKAHEEILIAYELGEYEKAIDMIEQLKSHDIQTYNHYSELDEIRVNSYKLQGVYGVNLYGPAGGWIFYDCDADNDSGNADGLISSECGWRYLEAAPADLRVVNGVPTLDSSVDGYLSAPKEYVFGSYKTSANGDCLFVNGTTSYNEADCTSTAIGSGKSNTEKLVSAMGDSAYIGNRTTDQYAAKLCHDLEYNGYDDWFLPAKDELAMMTKNRKENAFSSYWSSSEYNGYRAYDAWYQFFSTGNQDNYSRTNGNYIRPCRAF